MKIDKRPVRERIKDLTGIEAMNAIHRILERGAEVSPDDRKWLYRKAGEFSVKEGHYNDAKRYFQEAGARPELFRELVAKSAEVYEKNKLYQLAQRAYEKIGDKESAARMSEIQRGKEKPTGLLKKLRSLFTILISILTITMIYFAFVPKNPTGNTIKEGIIQPGAIIIAVILVMSTFFLVFQIRKKAK